MNTHELETNTKDYSAVILSQLTFLLVKENGMFNAGEYLRIFELEDGVRNGSSILLKIRHVLSNSPGLEKGYCILGFIR